MSTDPTPLQASGVQYVLQLLDVDAQRARYTSDKAWPVAAIPRDLWEQLGRPLRLLMRLEAR